MQQDSSSEHSPQDKLSQENLAQEKELHWLVRPTTIRRLWIGFYIVLALTLIAQFFVPVHSYFGVDGVFGFYAAYGFFTCIFMVVFAKLLGLLLKRPDNFYDDV